MMTHYFHPENERIVRFPVDGLILEGTLHHPGTPCPTVVIGCHGLFAGRSSPKQTALARAVCRQGIAFFRLDHRGCGQSQGNFKEVTTLEARCRDLQAAMAMLREDFDLSGPLGLFGSSMGGAVCLATACSTPVDCLVVNAAPVDFDSVITVLEQSGEIHKVSKRFLEERPVLGTGGILPVSRICIFHGGQDQTVPVSHAHALYAMCRDPKKLVIFPGGDHRMSDPGDQEVFVQESAAWFARFLHP